MQATEQRIEKLSSSTNQREASIDQTVICGILFKAQYPMKHLGFESNTARYKRKTLPQYMFFKS